MQTVMPERSVEQRMRALEVGNRHRSFRAVIKVRIKAGEEDARAFLLDPPVEMRTMRVVELLRAVPKVGSSKIDRLLMLNHVSHSKTLSGLTERQRTVLADAMSPYCGRLSGTD